METVQDDPDRFMIGAPHDLPGIAIVVDMPPPCERLETYAQSAACSQLTQLVKIGGGTVDAAERGRQHVAAYQQEIGLQFLHHIEFAFGARKVAGALRLE